jgi:hypothetical protein
VNDQLGLLLRRERLGQNDRCGRFHSPLKEISNLGSSWKIFHVVIITIDKKRVSRVCAYPYHQQVAFFLS